MCERWDDFEGATDLHSDILTGMAASLSCGLKQKPAKNCVCGAINVALMIETEIFQAMTRADRSYFYEIVNEAKIQIEKLSKKKKKNEDTESDKPEVRVVDPVVCKRMVASIKKWLDGVEKK